MTLRRRFMASASAGLVVLAVAACGGSSANSSSGSAASGSASSAASGSASSAASSGSAAAGGSGSVKLGPKGHAETIGWLDAQVSAPIQTRYYKLAQEAAKDLGWTIDFQNLDGNVAAASTDMAGLLANHVKAIITSAIEPAWITQQLAAAKAQGVPVIQVGGADGPDPNSYKASYAGVYVENEAALAQPLGKQIAAALSHGGQWGAVLTPLIYDSAARFAAVKAALAGDAGVKLVATDNVSLTDRVATAASDIKSMLEANPNITAIFGGLDFVTLAASEALQETHLAGKVKVYSFYTEPGNKSLMEGSSPTLTSVSDGNQAETSLVGMDQLVNKLLLGKAIQFNAAPLEPYFYKTYDAAQMNGIQGDQGPVPFSQLIAPYLARWRSEGVLAK